MLDDQHVIDETSGSQKGREWSLPLSSLYDIVRETPENDRLRLTLRVDEGEYHATAEVLLVEGRHTRKDLPVQRMEVERQDRTQQEGNIWDINSCFNCIHARTYYEVVSCKQHQWLPMTYETFHRNYARYLCGHFESMRDTE